MINFLTVGLGGAIGAMCRYGLGLVSIKSNFPFMTLIINFTGALLIGFFVGLMMTKKDMDPKWVMFVKIGICGGYTTFSSLSLEVLDMFDDNHPFIAVAYAAVSVVSCVLGVWAGRKLVIG